MSKSFKNSQVFHRMNFLSQCQEILLEDAPEVSNLQAFYGHTLHILSRKTQSKLEPSLKRSMCKKCSTFLVAGTNARVRTRGTKGCKRVVVTCKICGTVKRFPCSDRQGKGSSSRIVASTAAAAAAAAANRNTKPKKSKKAPVENNCQKKVGLLEK